MKIEIPSYGDYDGGETISLDKGYSALVQIERDDDCGEPWTDEDGHGPVSTGLREGKAPGQMVLGPTGNRDIWYLYDFAEAVKIARRDGWDTKPYNTGTAGERAHRAAMADYENLRAWCNDEWHYIGVIVTVYRHGTEIASDSLWGIEDCGDYWQEVARDMITGAVDADIADRKKAAAAARKETHERNHWACRDVMTA